MTTAASAADGAGNYAIWGVGSGSCNRFLHADERDDGQAPFKHYLMGYLTAYNTLYDDTYNALGAISIADAMDWLTDYCDLHKLDSFERAIMQLVDTRHKQRLRRPSGAARGWGAARPDAR